MLKSILYMLGTAGIFYLAVLYQSKALLVVCGTAVLLPFLFLCVLFYQKQKINYELLFSSYPIEHTKDYLVGLRAENPSEVWFPRIRAKIQVKNTATGKKKWVKVEGKLSAGSDVELTGRIEEPEFGVWQAVCKEVSLYEWTNFWHLNSSVKKQKQVMIFPTVHETNIKIGIRTRLFLSDGEQYHPQVSGDDPSETLKLREYQKGDRMNRIHWKLSAKYDELMVAELGMPAGCNVVIFLDAEPASMEKEVARAYWETLQSIAQKLLTEECPYYLVWRERQYREILCRKSIRKVEDLLNFWCEISPAEMEKGADPKVYADVFFGERYASKLVWNQKLELVSNDKPAIQIKPGQVSEQLMELELLL